MAHPIIGKNHKINQSQKGVKDDSDTCEDSNDKLVPHWPQMRDDSLAITTIEELVNSITQSSILMSWDIF